MITIRKATPDDAASIISFQQAMAMETEGMELKTDIITKGVMAVFHYRTKGQYYVAEDLGAVVASLMITYEWSDWRNKTFWWISSYYVKPEFRGRGIYPAMDEKLQELAAKEGNVCGFRTYAHKGHKQAQDVFRNLGMVEKEYLIFEDML